MDIRTALAALVLMLGTQSAQAARVVTLSPHLAELTCSAGACDQLVGVVAHSDYPQAVKQLPEIGSAFAVNAEALLSLKPDLVLAWDGGTPPDIIARLRGLGFKVEMIRIRTLADIEQAVLHIGAMLGTEVAARTAVAEYREQLDRLAVEYRGATKLRVFYQLDANPIFTINRDSPISEVIALCGGINVFADLPQLAGSLGTESVLAANPDVVIWGRQDPAAGAIEAFWKRWPQTNATKHNHLFAIDADTLSRATLRIVDGTKALCEALEASRQ